MKKSVLISSLSVFVSVGLFFGYVYSMEIIEEGGEEIPFELETGKKRTREDIKEFLPEEEVKKQKMLPGRSRPPEMIELYNSEGENYFIKSDLLFFSERLKGHKEKDKFELNYPGELFPLLETAFQFARIDSPQVIQPVFWVNIEKKHSKLLENPQLCAQAILMFDYVGLPNYLIDVLAKACAQALRDKEELLHEQVFSLINQVNPKYIIGIAKRYELAFNEPLEIVVPDIVEGEEIEKTLQPGFSVRELMESGKIGQANITKVTDRFDRLRGYEINFSNLNLQNLDGFDDFLKEHYINPLNIIVINISENNLTNLPEDFVAASQNLQNLDLSRNQLEQLPEKLASNHPNLKIVDASDNKLKAIPDAFLSNSKNVKVLILTRNEIENFPKNFFDKFTNLETLWLGCNRLSKLPDLDENSEIKRVLLYDNNISSILPDYLEYNELLERLVLSGNPISQEQLDALDDHVKKALQDGEAYWANEKDFHGECSAYREKINTDKN